ncbi:MAG: hypothetical protein DMF23_15505 [Verrucomicrobia bacterium]|nr:MAG: hypothetical protein DMF23_15505 [Verrucomicrobiota bacterium]
MKTIILISLLAILCTTVHAQDPVKTSPQYYKVLLENDQVRVLEYRLKAGDCCRGETIWRDPTTHAVENIGDTEAHAIAVDLKRSGPHSPLTT